MTCADVIAGVGKFGAPTQSGAPTRQSEPADAFSAMLGTLLPEAASAQGQNELDQVSSHERNSSEEKNDPQLAALAALFAGYPLPSSVVPVPRPDVAVASDSAIPEKTGMPNTEVGGGGPAGPAATSGAASTEPLSSFATIPDLITRGSGRGMPDQPCGKGTPQPLETAFTARISRQEQSGAAVATQAPQTTPVAEGASVAWDSEPVGAVQAHKTAAFATSPAAVAPDLARTQAGASRPGMNLDQQGRAAASADAEGSGQPRIEGVRAGVETSSQGDRHSPERRPSSNSAPDAAGVQQRADPTPTSVHHLSAPEPASPSNRTSGPREMPAPVPRQPASEPQRQQVPVQNLRVKVGMDDLRSVDLNISQRGSAVQVSVRSADPSLNASLREHLPALTENVQRSGYRMEAFAHGEAASGAGLTREHTPEVSHQGAAWQQEHDGGAHGHDREQPARRRRTDKTGSQQQFQLPTVLEVS